MEALQKRAIQIIFQSFTRGMPYKWYNFTLFVANLISLAARRDEISRKFFEDITQPSSCLHHLLPAQKDELLTSRLRSQEKFTRVYTRTKRYCSFIHYALNNYQVKSSYS